MINHFAKFSRYRLVDKIEAMRLERGRNVLPGFIKDVRLLFDSDRLSHTGELSDYRLRTDNQLFIDWQVFHLSSTSAIPEELDYPFY